MSMCLALSTLLDALVVYPMIPFLIISWIALLYAAQRERLLVANRNIIAPTLHPATLPLLEKEAYVKILLFGYKDISSEENILLFRATQIYIFNSN